MAETSVARFYADDHGRLDALFTDFQSLKVIEPELACQRFREFKAGLERHIAWEEGLLFPLFEAKTGFRDAGPTAVMRYEHEQIRQVLNLIDASLDGDAPSSGATESRLAALLEAHNWKEESILYPMLDERISADERDQIFRSMTSAK